jgi:hypothetical protein
LSITIDPGIQANEAIKVIRGEAQSIWNQDNHFYALVYHHTDLQTLLISVKLCPIESSRFSLARDGDKDE